MSTSSIAELVATGELDGWDDPKAPTVQSLRRRGIRGQAIVEAMTELGLSTSDVSLSMSAIYAENRELVDDEANRRFLVRDPVERQVVGGPESGHPPLHPDHEERGDRDLSVTGGVMVEAADLPPHGERIWLKGYGPVRHTRDAFEHTGEDIEVVRSGEVDVVHWVPATDAVTVRLRTPEGDETGWAEAGLAAEAVDNIVQFERVGFARVDSPASDPVVCYFAHP